MFGAEAGYKPDREKSEEASRKPHTTKVVAQRRVGYYRTPRAAARPAYHAGWSECRRNDILIGQIIPTISRYVAY